MSFQGRDGGGAHIVGTRKCDDDTSSATGSNGNVSFMWEASNCSSSSPVMYSLLLFALARFGRTERQTPSWVNGNYSYINGYASQMLSVSKKSSAWEAFQMVQWVTLDSDCDAHCVAA